MPGPVLSWGIGIVTLMTAGMVASGVAKLVASCRHGRSAICGSGVGVQ